MKPAPLKQLLACLSLFTITIALGAQNAKAQDQMRLAIDSCQAAVKDRITREQPGPSPRVEFDGSPQLNPISSAETAIRGRGRYYRDNNDRGRIFTYNSTYNTRTGRITQPAYAFVASGGMGGGIGSGFGEPENLPAGTTWFEGMIVSRSSDKCLDIYKGQTAAGVKVQQFDCHGQDNEIWSFVAQDNGVYSITNRKSGKVLDVADKSKNNGSRIQQNDWNHANNQLWRVEALRGEFYQLVNVGSGKCLTVEAGSLKNETPLIQFDCQRSEGQAFRMVRRQ